MLDSALDAVINFIGYGLGVGFVILIIAGIIKLFTFLKNKIDGPDIEIKEENNKEEEK